MSTLPARQNMHDGQLRPNHVTHPALLAAALATPRENYTSNQSVAYTDSPAPLGAQGRCMPTPTATARLIQALDLKEDFTLAIIAGGTGYSACLAAPLVQHILFTEEDRTLLNIAKQNHERQHIINISYTNLSPMSAPSQACQAILLDTATPTIPPMLIKYLPIGGRLATLLQNAQGLTQGVLLTKTTTSSTITQILFDTNCPLHPTLQKEQDFVF